MPDINSDSVKISTKPGLKTVRYRLNPPANAVTPAGSTADPNRLFPQSGQWGSVSGIAACSHTEQVFIVGVSGRPSINAAAGRYNQGMKFFLDTANLDELRKGADWGIVDGVTTNPSLIAKEGVPLEDQIRRICDIVDGDISAEVVSTKYEEMVPEARKLAKIHRNIVVKVPLTRDGIKTTAQLSKEGIRFNVTLCFSAGQAILAAKAGAYFVSPFVGRLDDISTEGMELIRQIVAIYRTHGYKTQVLAASLRSPLHVVQAATAGAHIGTMPFKALEMLFNHPLTDKGLDQFLKDYAKAFQEAGVR